MHVKHEPFPFAAREFSLASIRKIILNAPYAVLGAGIKREIAAEDGG